MTVNNQQYRERDYFDYSRGLLSWAQLYDRLKLRKDMTGDKLEEIFKEIGNREEDQ